MNSWSGCTYRLFNAISLGSNSRTAIPEDAGPYGANLKANFDPMEAWQHVLTDELSCKA